MTIQYPKGNITHVKNNFEGWSPVKLEDAIKCTEGKHYEYYTSDKEFGEIVFSAKVVDGENFLVPANPKLNAKLLYQLPYQVYDKNSRIY